MLMPLNWMCIFENRFRITATYTAIISNLYLGTMVFYFSLAIVFLYLTIPIITLRTRWLLRLTTECYKWIVVFEMVTFIVKISICMANWYSRYLRLFGERDRERESLAFNRVCEMRLCFFPLCESSSAGFMLNIGKESNYGHTSSGICRQHFEIQFQTYVT